MLPFEAEPVADIEEAEPFEAEPVADTVEVLQMLALMEEELVADIEEAE